MSDVKIIRSPDMARHVERCVSSVPYVAGMPDLAQARARMMLAFSQSAAPAKLRECSGESVAYCIALSAVSGLMPGGPHPDVWIIPRRRKGVWEANWQMSYRGFKRLAEAAGYAVDARLVFEGEDFNPDYSQTIPHHVPNVDEDPDWRKIRLGYVVVRDPLNRTRWAMIRRAELEKRRAKAQTQEVWNEWPLEMYAKTVIAWGGAREMWPLSEAARYAIHSDALAEIGRQHEIAQRTLAEAMALPPVVTPAAEADDEPPPPEPDPPEADPLPPCKGCSGEADGFTLDGVPLCTDCAGGATLTGEPPS